ncbi:MAG: DUF5667 domain-containing protein [Actinomycetota bacterium]
MKDKNKDYEEYKEYEDYEDLAKTVDALKTAATSPVEPDPRFKASARARVLGSLPVHKRVGLRLAAVFAAFALALSGVAAASSNSLPGDTLYPVKRTVEQGRVFLERNDETRAEIYADLADKRLTETEALVRNKRNKNVDATLQLMGSEYDLAQASINRIPPERRERMLARLEKANARQMRVLQTYLKNTNVPRAVVVRALARIERNREMIREVKQSLKARP